MVIAGDSAGGHLAVDLLLQPDVAHPAAMVLMSPLVDLTFELARAREALRRDPAIRVRDAERLVGLYCAGTDLAHPRLTLDVAGGRPMPPTLIQAGGAEMLRRRRQAAGRRHLRRGRRLRTAGLARPGARLPGAAPPDTGGGARHAAHRAIHRRVAAATTPSTGRRDDGMGIFGSSKKRSHDAAAVITGAGSGIGAAFAVELAHRGGRVVCSDIDETAARTTADGIVAAGGEALATALRRRPTRRRHPARRRSRRTGSAARRPW